MIKRSLIVLIVMSLVLYLQTTLMNHLAYNDVKPDLIMIFLIYFSILYGSTFGTSMGFVVGLMQDFISMSPLGFHSLILAVIGFIFGLAGKSVSTTSWMFQILSVLIGIIIKYILALISISLFSMENMANSLMSGTFFIELVYSCIAAPIIFTLLNLVLTRWRKI